MKKRGVLRAGVSLLAVCALLLPGAAWAGGVPSVADRVIREPGKALDINVAYPEVSGLRDAALQKQINGMFRDSVDAAIEEVSEAAKEDAKGGYEINEPYVAFSNYKVHLNDGEFLSLCMLVYQYMGGAHGGSYSVCANVRNTSPGKMLTLSDLFVPGSDYIPVLNGFVGEFLSKDPYLSSDNTFETVSPDQWFYLTDGALVLVFGEYEIGPYAFGMPEVSVPRAQINDILIPELRV